MVGIRTFVDEGLGHSSYLVDLGDGTAAIVDPPRFPTAHLAGAKASSLETRWTIDTHSHADYVTGSPALAADDTITFVAPAASRLETPHLAVRDEERMLLAPGVTLRANATPGHTPDHHVYLFEQAGAPVALFTGGSLMVGAVGRTDLCGPDLAEPLARDMFHSLRRLDGLPDDLAVYPTHGAGSFCSAPGGSERTTTLGRERATNHLFRIDDEDNFVEELLAGFARGHVPGSMSIVLRPVFASWLGWLTPLDRPIVIVAADGQDRDEVVRQCLDVGHESIVGELDGGIEAWRSAGRPVTTVPLVGAEAMVGTVVDVRQRAEFEAGHVPGAINVELGSLAQTPLPDAPVTVMCGHGERAMTGASILTARNHRDVSVLDGGPDTWTASTARPLTVGR
jgi:glyoxylase-like metal-dependent hydrolase (beta-lactamase superfamily II)/rhodanese-related sulfurtransferase